jgi:hypothetical protein
MRHILARANAGVESGIQRLKLLQNQKHRIGTTGEALARELCGETGELINVATFHRCIANMGQGHALISGVFQMKNGKGWESWREDVSARP